MSNLNNLNHNNHIIKVNHISTFGEPIRGVSPYSNELLSELKKFKDIEHNTTNCVSKVANYFHPAKQITTSPNPNTHLDFLNPLTWKNTFADPCHIAHAQYWTPLQIPALIYIVNNAKKRNIKTVLTVHNPKQHENLPFIADLERKLFSLADNMVVHTRKGEQLLRKLGISPKINTAVIPHGAPSFDAHDTTANLFIPSTATFSSEKTKTSDRQHIVFFGNIRKYKGVELLLDAWEIAELENQNVDLIIAGRLWKGTSIASSIAGRLLGTKKVADEILKRRNLKKPKNTIYLLDFIKEEDCATLFQDAKLAIFPYLNFESQSGAAIKAASHGTPLIVSNTGGLASLAIDESFVLPDKFDQTDLANLITSKIQSYTPDMRLRQLEKLSEISWEKIAQKYRELYFDILEKTMPFAK